MNREHCPFAWLFTVRQAHRPPAIVSAAHNKDALRHRLTSWHRPDSARLLYVRSRADQADRCRPRLGQACLVRHAGWAALGRSGVDRALMSRTLATPEEDRGPWCELDWRPTLNNWGGPYRRMEVITMAVVAMLIAAGVVALISVGLFFVVWGALLAMFAVDKAGSARWHGVHSGDQ
jgi:hypothetical protein